MTINVTFFANATLHVTFHTLHVTFHVLHVTFHVAQVWEAMLGDGIVPHGGMLASYLQALMKAGDWKAALEMRERYRGGDGLSRAEKHVDKLDLMSREDAVVDGVLASGLVDNGQPRLALEYVLEVLRARSLVSSLRTRFPDHPMVKRRTRQYRSIPSHLVPFHFIPYHWSVR